MDYSIKAELLRHDVSLSTLKKKTTKKTAHGYVSSVKNLILIRDTIYTIITSERFI